MKNLTTLTLAACAALTLTACGGSDEWSSQQARDVAFREYACQRMETDDPEEVGSAVFVTIPRLTEADAGDRAVAMGRAQMVQNGVITPTCDFTSADYDRWFNEAWQLVLEEREGADFTPQVARDRGIDVE